MLDHSSSDSREMLAAIQGTRSAAIFNIDTEGHISFWNIGAEKLFGFQDSEMLGKHCSNLCPPEEIHTLNKMLAKLLRGRITPEIAIRLQRKNHSAVDVLLSIHPFRKTESTPITGALIICTDISAKKAAEKALIERANQIKAIVETVPDAIVTINTEGIIEAVNPAVRTIFGYAEPEIIGCHVSIPMPSPYREAHDQYLANYLHTRKAKVIGIAREVTGRR